MSDFRTVEFSLRKLREAVDAAKAFRAPLLQLFEAATIAADHAHDREVRAELVSLKEGAAAVLAQIDEVVSLADAYDADDFDDEPDIEAEIARREEAEYQAGKAEAELRRAERAIYGDELAEQFHAQDDLNRYNRGED